MIENFNNSRNDIVKAKTEKKKAEAKAFIDDNTAAIRELYAKAIEYLKANALDLVKECTYQPWDAQTEARVNNWIEIVDAMEDPATVSAAPVQTQHYTTHQMEVSQENDDPVSGFMDMPF